MAFYGLMTVMVTAIFILMGLIWRKTRDLSFPVGILLLYYWSLHGAWKLIGNKLQGTSGIYTYLENKLFPVNLDEDYFLTLLLYGLFVLVIEFVLLIFLPPAPPRQRSLASPAPVRINHFPILVITALAGLGSYWLVRDSLHLAQELNVSAYDATRGITGEVPAHFTLHQLLNRVALLPSALGLAVLLSGPRPRLLRGNHRPGLLLPYLLPYAAVLIGMVWFSMILGNKNEILAALLAGTLFYLANAERPRYLALSGFAAVGMMVLGLVDLLRGASLANLTGAFQNLDPSDYLGALTIGSNSNEAFAAHFSLYGALSQNIPPTGGTSILALAASLIPRGLWPDRPDDIYAYYASAVNAVAGQGYTIHHATGWYLNFGLAGVALGGIVLGAVWVAIYRSHRRLDRIPMPLYILRVLMPAMFVAYLPNLVRSGIEGYKGIVFEAFAIPFLVLTAAAIRWPSSRPARVAPRTALPRAAP
jgi:hypothetical protein